MIFKTGNYIRCKGTVVKIDRVIDQNGRGVEFYSPDGSYHSWQPEVDGGDYIDLAFVKEEIARRCAKESAEVDRCYKEYGAASEVSQRQLTRWATLDDLFTSLFDEDAEEYLRKEEMK